MKSGWERKKCVFCLFNLEGREVAIKFILNSEKNTLIITFLFAFFFSSFNPNCLFGEDKGKGGYDKLANILYKIRKDWIMILFSY